MMFGYGDVAEIYDGELDIVDAEFGSDLGTVLDEQARSKFVDSMDHYISEICLRLSASDITIPEEEVRHLDEERKEAAVLKQKREELSFLYKARNRFVILLIIFPVAWIYVRSLCCEFRLCGTELRFRLRSRCHHLGYLAVCSGLTVFSKGRGGAKIFERSENI